MSILCGNIGSYFVVLTKRIQMPIESEFFNGFWIEKTKTIDYDTQTF
jgi:hypothetical protein